MDAAGVNGRQSVMGVLCGKMTPERGRPDGRRTGSMARVRDPVR